MIYAQRAHFDTQGHASASRELVDVDLGRQPTPSGLLEQQPGFLQSEIPSSQDVDVVGQVLLCHRREHLFHHVPSVSHGIRPALGTAWQPRKVVLTGIRSRALNRRATRSILSSDSRSSP